MKEDILEQLVDEYLMHKGYFTMHNVKFKPPTADPGFDRHADSVASDIDVIAYHPCKRGVDRVIAVSCKSWQAGFDVRAILDRIDNEKKSGGRYEWQKYRELCSPKWSRAFLSAIKKTTGASEFTYWTAVTRLQNPAARHQWEERAQFRAALGGNPIRIKAFDEMLDDVWERLSTTPAATELGRMIQLMKASRWLDKR